MTWIESTLPGCFGWPCETLTLGNHVARVWQESPTTHPWGARWLWSIDRGDIQFSLGNRGIAKSAAQRALTKRAKGAA